MQIPPPSSLQPNTSPPPSSPSTEENTAQPKPIKIFSKQKPNKLRTPIKLIDRSSYTIKSARDNHNQPPNNELDGNHTDNEAFDDNEDHV